jgi:hypothetical protein
MHGTMNVKVTVDVGFLCSKAAMLGDTIKRTRRVSTTFSGRDWNVAWQNCSEDGHAAADRSLLDINLFCYQTGYIGVPVVSVYRNVKLVWTGIDCQFCLSIRWIHNYRRIKHHQIARVNGIVMHGSVCVTVSPTAGGKLPAGQIELVVLSSSLFHYLKVVCSHV